MNRMLRAAGERAAHAGVGDACDQEPCIGALKIWSEALGRMRALSSLPHAFVSRLRIGLLQASC